MIKNHKYNLDKISKLLVETNYCMKERQWSNLMISVMIIQKPMIQKSKYKAPEIMYGGKNNIDILMKYKN